MQLHLSPDIPDDGEYDARMNPGGAGAPFGVISLGAAELFIETDEDADRLIRAAVRTKAMRAAIGTPHEFANVAGRCATCGIARKGHDALTPAPEQAEGGADGA